MVSEPVKYDNEPRELGHALNHIVQARTALIRQDPCAARAHLREARLDLNYAVKQVTAQCEAYIEKAV